MKRLTPENGRRSGGPARYWKAIRAFGEAGFTMRELHAKAGPVSRDAVQFYVKGLLDIGVLRIVGEIESGSPSRFKAKIYRCVRCHGPAPRTFYGKGTRRHGRARTQMWNAMRVLANFRIAELAVAASTEDYLVERDRAKEFVCALMDAGLVDMVEPRHGALNGSTPAVYRLNRRGNSGPRPPVLCKTPLKGVFDDNRQVFIPSRSARGREVSA